MIKCWSGSQTEGFRDGGKDRESRVGQEIKNDSKSKSLRHLSGRPWQNSPSQNAGLIWWGHHHCTTVLCPLSHPQPLDKQNKSWCTFIVVVYFTAVANLAATLHQFRIFWNSERVLLIEISSCFQTLLKPFLPFLLIWRKTAPQKRINLLLSIPFAFKHHTFIHTE